MKTLLLNNATVNKDNMPTPRVKYLENFIMILILNFSTILKFLFQLSYKSLTYCMRLWGQFPLHYSFNFLSTLRRILENPILHPKFRLGALLEIFCTPFCILFLQFQLHC
jgi:hypothetical protein